MPARSPTSAISGHSTSSRPNCLADTAPRMRRATAALSRTSSFSLPGSTRLSIMSSACSGAHAAPRPRGSTHLALTAFPSDVRSATHCGAAIAAPPGSAVLIRRHARILATGAELPSPTARLCRCLVLLSVTCSRKPQELTLSAAFVNPSATSDVCRPSRSRPSAFDSSSPAKLITCAREQMLSMVECSYAVSHACPEHRANCTAAMPWPASG